MGIIDKWKAMHFPVPYSCDPDGLPEAVSLEDASPIFMLFIYAIIVDTAILLLEFLWFKLRRTFFSFYKHFKVYIYSPQLHKEVNIFQVFYRKNEAF